MHGAPDACQGGPGPTCAGTARPEPARRRRRARSAGATQRAWARRRPDKAQSPRRARARWSRRARRRPTTARRRGQSYRRSPPVRSPCHPRRDSRSARCSTPVTGPTRRALRRAAADECALRRKLARAACGLRQLAQEALDERSAQPDRKVAMAAGPYSRDRLVSPPDVAIGDQEHVATALLVAQGKLRRRWCGTRAPPHRRWPPPHSRPPAASATTRPGARRGCATRLPRHSTRRSFARCSASRTMSSGTTATARSWADRCADGTEAQRVAAVPRVHRAGPVESRAARSSSWHEAPSPSAPPHPPDRSAPMSYIDGFVIAVPTANKQKFIDHARHYDSHVPRIGRHPRHRGLGRRRARGQGHRFPTRGAGHQRRKRWRSRGSNGRTRPRAMRA